MSLCKNDISIFIYMMPPPKNDDGVSTVSSDHEDSHNELVEYKDHNELVEYEEDDDEDDDEDESYDDDNEPEQDRERKEGMNWHCEPEEVRF